ncbi:MAG: glycosyl hydrolase 115 family protein [Bacteroidota bacterium]
MLASKISRRSNRMLITVMLCIGFGNPMFGQGNIAVKLKVAFTKSPGSFLLVSAGRSAHLLTDSADAKVVQIAAETFREDIDQVTGIRIELGHQIVGKQSPVIIGTVGHSYLIDELIERGKLNIATIKGKWETFAIAVIDHPFKDVSQALVIAGSDPRGTAFGVFELSRMMGVSPMVWWADVTPQHHDGLYITPGKIVVGPPSVKYRGIFLNDEDWGLQPWAAKNLDTDIKDIGPKTYQRVFELLLRLKANYIWPAMHPCTKAFWYYPDNAKLAEQYGIVLGASHCEPMLRNNVFEWADHFKNEYGAEPGEWRYDVNPKQIYTYWNDRVKASKQNDAVYTVGMRGIHDGGMPGPPDQLKKVKILEDVIHDQRMILTEQLGRPATRVPQIFCPYKEVLDLYQAGLKLPDDITIVWADDNYGYIRQLSDPSEQKRSGRSGVYYHLSYYGNPADYLWLSTNSPSLIAYEMGKAYHLGADRLWIFNAGDIKPAEAEIQFAMDMAWDIKKWPPENAINYSYHWALDIFGAGNAKEIAQIKNEYYALGAAGKPEHIDAIKYSEAEINTRLTRYRDLANKAQILAGKITPSLKDAYFELVQYPVVGACLMNEKIFFAQKGMKVAKTQDALAYSQRALAAYDTIQQLTAMYNTEIAHGKWKGMMSSHPRDRNIFKMPAVAKTASTTIRVSKDSSATLIKEIQAAAFVQKQETGDSHIKVIKGLGTGEAGIAILPYTIKNFDLSSIPNAPSVTYQVDMPAGRILVGVKCLPTFPLYRGLNLRYGISINNGPVQQVNIDTKAETKQWDVNVLRGFSLGETEYQHLTTGNVTVRIFFPDPGLVINSILIKHI